MINISKLDLEANLLKDRNRGKHQSAERQPKMCCEPMTSGVPPAWALIKRR